MSVYKPPNSSIFLYDFQHRGRRFYGSTGQKTERAAKQVEGQKRAAAALNLNQKPTITLDEAAGIYEQKLRKEERWSGNTEGWVDNLVNALGPGNLINEIRHTDIGKHFRARAAVVSGSTVNREIDVARALWRATERAKYEVGEMPDWGAMRYAVKANDPRELRFDEEDRLFDAIREDAKPMVRFALLSGWRVSEVRNLLWSDIDYPSKVAWATVKGGDRVKRPLTTDMIVLIASQTKACPQIFTYVCQKSRAARQVGELRHPARQKGHRYPFSRDGWRKIWKAALDEAGIDDFRFHDLRHTRGTRILRQTGNLAAAQKALRHSNIKTTLRYAHAFDDDVRNALDASESRTITDVPKPEVKKARKSAG
ncbi:MAG TPA: site-specific integrase [Sphingobium sp.]|uniref:tyrosine-type recombinase/integrase n=1 Tax=Sphingobium sp. TaxID=1912891 RepID=UPI002ED64807